jgi:hypothetical protein
MALSVIRNMYEQASDSSRQAFLADNTWFFEICRG